MWGGRPPFPGYRRCSLFFSFFQRKQTREQENLVLNSMKLQIRRFSFIVKFKDFPSSRMYERNIWKKNLWNIFLCTSHAWYLGRKKLSQLVLSSNQCEKKLDLINLKAATKCYFAFQMLFPMSSKKKTNLDICALSPALFFINRFSIFCFMLPLFNFADIFLEQSLLLDAAASLGLTHFSCLMCFSAIYWL